MSFAIKKSIFTIISILLVFIFFETISFFTLNYLHSKGVVYKSANTISFEKYSSVRDTLLGWPNPNSFGKDSIFDNSGSRIIPEFPDPEKDKPLISMYGDSFTFGAEVSNKYSIANQLSKIIGKRVSNYGVGGYGTDQSYIRYLSNTNDSAKIVILNHFVMDIVRNVNQYRDIIASAGGLGFKPRFIFKNEKFELVPIIELNQNNFSEVLEDPADYFHDDYFINKMPGGYIKYNFPYTLKVLQSYSHFRVKEQLFGGQYYFEFYNLDHPSDALEITRRIILEFINTAKKRNQIPVFMITPNVHSFEYYFENNKWPYANLLSLLNENEVDVINLGEELLLANTSLNYCDYYIDCVGHFNENGNKIVAEIIYNYLYPKYEIFLN